MKTRHAIPRVWHFAAGLAFLAGCSSNGTTPSIGTGASPVSSMDNYHGKLDFATFNKLVAMTNATHQGAPAVQHPLTHSWMKAPPKGVKGTIWVGDVSYATVDVISYPSGTLVGQVAGFSFPQGDCSDTSGNVYVADAGSDYGYEIQAGTTKVIKSWNLGGGYAIGCSVSKNGDVSFTQFYTIQGNYAYPGGVWVFPGGGATGTFYAGPGYDWPAGYDKKGNLFVTCDYVAPCSSPSLAELSGSTWTFLNFDTGIGFPGAVQLMGAVLGIADQASSGEHNMALHYTRVNGSNAHVVKTVVFTGANGCAYTTWSGSWGSISKKPNGIQSIKGAVKDIAAANSDCYPSGIDVWNAKKGGAPIASFEPVSGDAYYAGATFTK